MSSILCKVIGNVTCPSSTSSSLHRLLRSTFNQLNYRLQLSSSSSSSSSLNLNRYESIIAEFADYNRLVSSFHQNLSKLLEDKDDLNVNNGHRRHVKDTLINELIALKEELNELETLSGKGDVNDATIESNHGELEQLIREELKTIGKRLDNVKQDSLDLLIQDELNQVNEVIVELEHAVGGQESMLFTKEMTEFYSTFASLNGWNVMSADVKVESECNGYRFASLRIQGNHVFNLLRHEAGVHRVQRVPKTEKNGRIHTSTISVQVIPLLEQTQLDLNRNSLKVETMRSQGAGGQNVNKTETCVRIIHLPTGIAVECQEQRSQSQNRTIAMEKLTIELSRRRADQLRRKELDIRKSQVSTVERSDKIRTYNFPQDRITEHRLREDLHNLRGYMRGECGDILNGWLQSLHEQRIKSLRQAMANRLEIEKDNTHNKISKSK